MLNVQNISFGYNTETILHNISFSVAQGQHVSIIGESGSGKSTLIKLLYGTYDLPEGEIFWNDTPILGPKFNLVIGYDFMKYVAQEFDLMPFITVEENIGKFLSNFFPEEKHKRTTELIKLVDLEAFTHVKVKQLSGGQKQRVALARAIARQPEIIILDEPFSHIDNFQKQTLRRNLFKYLKDNNISCVVATHDREDVLPYSDHMIVLNNGRIIANDTPKQLYNNPEQPLIASFFDEFNTFQEFQLGLSNSDSNVFVYAHELEVCSKSELEVKVVQNYFRGNTYLVEVEFELKSLFFYNKQPLVLNETIYLKLTESAEQRLALK
ncbi:ABC transporter, ATP-binding protein [Formosa agariphila KMM 3901]|uniref:ABC transporter, ATP-binding protein n=1 Tax=Formosa agariphila (strain DSM 15362 / KCTC 12365 / LMG 23005 / KMM 3901 / M-2Alg 35-1) TaxID=1347342 RepID=T2KH67_FORAG|nr:ABC transporter ATP-binding protein [Formosa agariphila]CDF77746.1 ABC transporter, ATP-binding protein [Formosa agariphila KMM 3901]